jgi:hypothetical protein
MKYYVTEYFLEGIIEIKDAITKPSSVQHGEIIPSSIWIEHKNKWSDQFTSDLDAAKETVYKHRIEYTQELFKQICYYKDLPVNVITIY